MNKAEAYFPDELKEMLDTIKKVFNNYYGSNDMVVYLQKKFKKSLSRAYEKFDENRS